MHRTGGRPRARRAAVHLLGLLEHRRDVYEPGLLDRGAQLVARGGGAAVHTGAGRVLGRTLRRLLGPLASGSASCVSSAASSAPCLVLVRPVPTTTGLSIGLESTGRIPLENARARLGEALEEIRRGRLDRRPWLVQGGGQPHGRLAVAPAAAAAAALLTRGDFFVVVVAAHAFAAQDGGGGLGLFGGGLDGGRDAGVAAGDDLELRDAAAAAPPDEEEEEAGEQGEETWRRGGEGVSAGERTAWSSRNLTDASEGYAGDAAYSGVLVTQLCGSHDWNGPRRRGYHHRKVG